MGDYLKPLRRKLGVVTLVMACVFAAGWVRSWHIQDSTSLFTSHSILGMTSEAASLKFTHYEPQIPGNIRLAPGSWIVQQGIPTVENLLDEIEQDIRLNGAEGRTIVWRYKWCGFDFSEFSEPCYTTRLTRLFFPYWSIVIPLTLLSAYLLLSKPRTLIQKKIAEPVSTE